VKPRATVARRPWRRAGQRGAGMATDEEFRGFFAQHYERLCRLGFLLTGDPAQAEELAQDARVRTWRRWRLVRKPDKPEAYARKVLVNRHRSLLRRALVEARYLSRDRPDEQDRDEHREDAIVLWAATRRLPRRQRTVLVLRYYEDLSEAEIARVLGVPAGTVKTLARRGLARLRRSLQATVQATGSASRSDHDTGRAATGRLRARGGTGAGAARRL
jgi:RNA polymerase sigma-70 factor (sigma-E family)